MDRKIRVCLIIEGSYPYITGGVSSWVHQLIMALPEIDFVIYSISPKAEQKLNYKMPPNVVGQKDIVISKNMHPEIKTNKSKSKMLSHIAAMHQLMQSGSNPDLDTLLKLVPDGYYLYDDILESDTGWSMIVKNNQLHNPAYAFSDYFWAWKSSHDMMFTVIGSTPPEADMYHAISTGYAGLAGIVAKLRTSKPLLLTEHGLYHKEREIEIKRTRFVKGYQRDMWTNIYNSLSRITYQYSDVIISLFEHNRRLQIQLGALDNKCRVIPNGIDIGQFASIPKEKRKGLHIGLVGRVVPIKDIKCFILTCRIISEMIPDAFFYCIGPTDEDQPYYEECVRLVSSFKLDDKFTFTGSVNVKDYYAFLDVAVLTSIREAQPLVILEAYAAKIPVVSTRVGNVPELLDYDDRFIAPSKDSEKLAQAVKFIYDHPSEMKEIIEKNLEKVYKFYDRKELHRTYANLYAEFLNYKVKG